MDHYRCSIYQIVYDDPPVFASPTLRKSIQWIATPAAGTFGSPMTYYIPAAM